jgi:hypothetical protein
MNEEIVEAINDLTRVTIALSGAFATKADGIRRLHELGIPSGRIAALLGIKQNDVTATIAKSKKSGGASGGKRG